MPSAVVGGPGAIANSNRCISRATWLASRAASRPCQLQLPLQASPTPASAAEAASMEEERCVKASRVLTSCAKENTPPARVSEASTAAGALLKKALLQWPRTGVDGFGQHHRKTRLVGSKASARRSLCPPCADTTPKNGLDVYFEEPVDMADLEAKHAAELEAKQAKWNASAFEHRTQMGAVQAQFEALRSERLRMLRELNTKSQSQATLNGGDSTTRLVAKQRAAASASSPTLPSGDVGGVPTLAGRARAVAAGAPLYTSGTPVGAQERRPRAGSPGAIRGKAVGASPSPRSPSSTRSAAHPIAQVQEPCSTRSPQPQAVAKCRDRGLPSPLRQLRSPRTATSPAHAPMPARASPQRSTSHTQLVEELLSRCGKITSMQHRILCEGTEIEDTFSDPTVFAATSSVGTMTPPTPYTSTAAFSARGNGGGRTPQSPTFPQERGALSARTPRTGAVTPAASPPFASRLLFAVDSQTTPRRGVAGVMSAAPVSSPLLGTGHRHRKVSPHRTLPMVHSKPVVPPGRSASGMLPRHRVLLGELARDAVDIAHRRGGAVRSLLPKVR
eukprot:CAMPEP_0170319874 /NCGR_PEP_ID=MMETSP0116_2-20130129/60656_1 /TAXON_ID=400756 /ORGANISM="Durinskia baltica, Strain CSIRO CS-38" /LENGTH=560 /DNA_ID=CAMNT_0010572615 /DNA_START=83 /DNA_END=1761 /DNA_ORIENTATION=-